MSTSVKGKNLEEILKNLQEDSESILRYMASNGLVANASKTVFMILNRTRKELESENFKSIEVDGAIIEASTSTNLLGITIQDNQGWSEHFKGRKGLINQLNKRTFAIRRIANQIPNNQIIKVVQSLWMSKLRYGLQLCNAVKISSEDTQSGNMKAAQIAQNKMVRMMGKVSLKDHIRSKDLLKKFGLLSINQLAAQIKLVEAWKTINVENYPIKLENNQLQRSTNGREVRVSTVKLWKDDTRVASAKESFIRDAAKLWNNAPPNVKNAKSLRVAKRESLSFCKTLPC